MKQMTGILLLILFIAVVSPLAAHADQSDTRIVLSERPESDGDDGLPDFLQPGIHACGIDDSQTLDPSTATVADVIEATRTILYVNEVGSNWNSRYGAVNRNDNGYGISAGILQWNGSNALKLLQTVIGRAPEDSKTILGEKLYGKITTASSWDGRYDASRFVPTEQEAAAIGQLLAGENGQYVQNFMAGEYIREYIELGYTSYGIKNAAALAYFCDLKNQCGIETVKRIVGVAAGIAGSASEITLNELHEASVMDSVAGTYLSRRYRTYQSVADVAVGKKWNYTKTGHCRIPSATVGTATSSSEVMWLQWALDQSIHANLDVDGLYGEETSEAILTFQTQYAAQYGLTADGYAGQMTITALIKVLNSLNLLGEAVAQGEPNMLDAPGLLRILSAADGVQLEWSAVDGADGYEIYRRQKKENSFRLLAKTDSGTDTVYVDTDAVSGKNYVYTVKAYNKLAKSECDPAGMMICYLEAPQSVRAAVTTSGTKLSWDKVSGADGYYVYRRASGGQYKKIASIRSKKKTSYTDTKGAARKTYAYVVKAYKGDATSAVSESVRKKYQKFVKYRAAVNVNYRSGAGTKYKIRGTLTAGKAVSVAKKSSKKANGYTWYKIMIGQKYYYVASKYLKKA